MKTPAKLFFALAKSRIQFGSSGFILSADVVGDFANFSYLVREHRDLQYAFKERTEVGQFSAIWKSSFLRCKIKSDANPDKSARRENAHQVSVHVFRFAMR